MTLDLGGSFEVLTVPLAPGYGDSSDVAHRLVVGCLTAASDPVLMTAGGAIHHLPREAIRQILVWSTRPGIDRHPINP